MVEIVISKMDKNFNWKPYIRALIIISILAFVINWKITFGLLIGTVSYFINDKLLSKRFPRLDSNARAFGSMFVYMVLQWAVIIITALVCWKVGKLFSFLSAFIGLTFPTFYFLIVGIFKR